MNLICCEKMDIATFRVYKMWKVFTSTGENSGFGKTSSGINISKSKELVVGLFYKSKI